MCFEPEVIVLLHVKHICCSAIARVGVDAVVFSIGVAIAKGTSAAELLCRRRRRNITLLIRLSLFVESKYTLL